jgi:hypothetical protein
MSLYLIGDIHGRVEEYLKLLNRLRQALVQSRSVICTLADQVLSFPSCRRSTNS